MPSRFRNFRNCRLSVSQYMVYPHPFRSDMGRLLASPASSGADRPVRFELGQLRRRERQRILSSDGGVESISPQSVDGPDRSGLISYPRPLAGAGRLETRPTDPLGTELQKPIGNRSMNRALRRSTSKRTRRSIRPSNPQVQGGRTVIETDEAKSLRNRRAEAVRDVTVRRIRDQVGRDARNRRRLAETASG